MNNPYSERLTQEVEEVASQLEDELFEWVEQTYQSDNIDSPNTTIDLTQYAVDYSIDKQPTGEETLTHFNVWKKE